MSTTPSSFFLTSGAPVMFFMSGTLLSFFLLLGLALIHETQEAGSSSISNDALSPNLQSIDISVGASLSTDAASSWLSPSGRFAFGFYRDGEGFFVGIQLLVSPSKTRVVWTARLDLKPFSEDAFINFTTEGFLLTPQSGKPPFTLFKLTSPASSAAMLDNGNFVVYSSNSSISQDPGKTFFPGKTISQDPDVSLVMAGTNVAANGGAPYQRLNPYSKGCNDKLLYSCRAGLPSTKSSNIIWRSFDYPTDTLLGSQALPCNHNLTSSASERDHSVGVYVLSMHCDGNLVLYNINLGTVTWDSGTSGGNYRSLVLAENGRLYLSTSSGNEKDLSGYKPQNVQSKMIYAAALDPDNIFRLYAVNLDTNSTQPVNDIPPYKDGCQAEDICGVNSYCKLVTNNPVCTCIPGFERIQGNAGASGCRRSIVLPSCSVGSGAGNLSMDVVPNIVGLDELAYSVISATTSNECSNMCVNDCDCYAAAYREQKCSKLKLPLTKGRIDPNDPGVAYVKLAVITNASDAGSVTRKREVRVVAIIVCVVVAGVICLAVMAACGGAYWHLFGKFRKQWEKWELALTEEIAPRSFSYDEIPKRRKEKLGEGGYGMVFREELLMGGKPVSVAVKELYGAEVNAEKDFKAEMSLIGRARHANLVRILGFCHDGHNRILIYEYMSRGSLAKHIFEIPSVRPDWARRVGLLLGAARGIHYLHRECENTIIHRDIKPENILISIDWTAKICDFGLAKHVRANITKVDTRTRAFGTEGYVAPECLQVDDTTGTITLSEKVDVYSYGVVVLETVCSNRLETDCSAGQGKVWSRGKVHLHDLVSFYKAGDVSTLLDGELVDASVLEKAVMVEILCVGILCVQKDPSDRPSMEEVVMKLEEVMVLMDVPKPQAPPSSEQPSPLPGQPAPFAEQQAPLPGQPAPLPGQ